MVDRVRVLKRISLYQFGVDIIPEEEVEPIVSKTGKLRFLLYRGQRYVGLEAKSTKLTLYAPAGLRLFELTDSWRVYITDERLLVTDLFVAHVEDADELIRPGDEVVVVYRDKPIAVGKARISGRSMRSFSRGVAVRIREKITSSGRSP